MLNRKIDRRYDENIRNLRLHPILKELAKLTDLRQNRLIGKEEFERLIKHYFILG